MYEELHFYDRPRDEDVIWRYLDLSKLIYILADEALPFIRLDLLEDKFEGYIPDKNMIADSELKDIPLEERPSLTDKLNKNYLNLARDARQTIFVNCWHINEHESAAMWKLYSKSPEGIAIRSTFGQLKDSLRDARQKVEIGKVKYIDYKSDHVDGAIMDRPALGMYKRKSFAHEQELRALHWDGKEAMDILHRTRKVNSKEIISIPVYVTTLIESVFIAPTSRPSYKSLIESVMEKYGIKKRVQQSSLAEDPIW